MEISSDFFRNLSTIDKEQKQYYLRILFSCGNFESFQGICHAMAQIINIQLVIELPNLLLQEA